MSIDDDKLMAFADGELTDAERAEIEGVLERDASLRERVEAHRNMRTRLAAAFDGVLSEPVPMRLCVAAEAPRTAEVINLPERRVFKWSAREFGAMAASVALGLVVGAGVTQQQPPMISTGSSGLVADGALDQALSTQLASDEAGAVRIGITFRDQEGDYCRTFDLIEGDASGLACRGNGAWTIQLMSGSSVGGEVRTAGASPDVLNTVDAMIVGEALDADAERAARDSDWRY